MIVFFYVTNSLLKRFKGKYYSAFLVSSSQDGDDVQQLVEKQI